MPPILARIGDAHHGAAAGRVAPQPMDSGEAAWTAMDGLGKGRRAGALRDPLAGPASRVPCPSPPTAADGQLVRLGRLRRPGPPSCPQAPGPAGGKPPAARPAAHRPTTGPMDPDRSSTGDTSTAIGASTTTGSDADPCRDSWGDNDNYDHCEVRDFNLPAGALSVDAGQNGGILVEGWDRNEVRVRAIVRGSAGSDARARELAAGVQVQASGGRVSASGPDRNDRREWWSVSYRINVPRKNDLDLNANNGGISITGVDGNVRFGTTNGGVRLTDMAGRVNGSTRNGGLTVNLGGDRWDGDGIDVQTSNGGVTLAVPEGYNAQLETRTTNGGFRSDIPITIQGELSTRRGISTQLGSGGPMVRVTTTNGGVKIARR